MSSAPSLTTSAAESSIFPQKYCGPAVKAELEYWGIEEDEIEECCWTNYSAWTSTLEALKKLERDRKVHMPGEEHWLRPGETTPSKLRQIRMNGWEVMNSPQSSITAKIYSYISLTFVVISIFSFIAQTHELFRVPLDPDPGAMVANSSATNATAQASNVTSTVKDDVHPALLYTDLICLIFFISEFVLRFTLSPRKCKLLMLPMTVFELLALLPDLIEFSVRIFHPSNRDMPAVDVITFLRLLRVFRIFRLMRHFPGLWILFYTLKASVKELLLLLMFLCVGMLLFASLIYYADDRKLFTSIPMACWWAVITMTTVGYGDMYPTTKWGYVVGSLTAICGVLVIGFTVPVLVNNFILYYQHTQCAINREESKKKRTKTKLDFQHAKAIKDEVEKQREKENPNVLKMERLRKLHLQHDIGTSSKDADSPKENGSGKECKRENDFNSNTHDSSYTSEKDTNPEAVSLL
ncbi:hypothetical protein BaRGS_00033202 [Batillaria attramentaria]|uniref:Ion transport domain-containing protein n=1 Tax=Batillaria attramentaria TaxID=370345 RepID=A0ABD0JL58_9CAEN